MYTNSVQNGTPLGRANDRHRFFTEQYWNKSKTEIVPSWRQEWSKVGLYYKFMATTFFWEDGWTPAVPPEPHRDVDPWGQDQDVKNAKYGMGAFGSSYTF